jgi:LysM repeat protein
MPVLTVALPFSARIRLWVVTAAVAVAFVASTGGCTSNASSPSSAEARTAEADSARNASSERAGAGPAGAGPSRGGSSDAKAAATEPAADAPRTVSERLQDATVEARVQQALVRASALRVFDFEVEAVRSRVVVRGDVNTRDQYDQAGRVTRRVGGVEAVDNRVTIGGRAVADSEGDDGAPDRPAAYHVVQSGESLWTIARRHDVPVDRLKRLNGLRSDVLRPGQRIRLR